MRARLSEIESDREYADERKVVKAYLTLMEAEATATKALKEAQSTLDAQFDAKYRKLTVDEIKTFTIDDKWLAQLTRELQGELDRVSQQLSQRINELAERYATPLPEMFSHVAELELQVNHHLDSMGFSWK